MNKASSALERVKLVGASLSDTASKGIRVPLRLLRTAFWLGVTICYLPTLPAHLVTPHDRSVACQQEPALRDKQQPVTFSVHTTVLSRGTLTGSDLAVPWRGFVPLPGLCKHHRPITSASPPPPPA
jgi:hypothetical protein